MKALCSILILIVGIICGIINKTQGRCMRTYSDLEQSIFSKDSNVEILRRAFYPVNKEPSNAVEIRYHFDDQSLPQPYRFRWSSSRVFGLLRPKVLQDLSFNVYSADVPMVDIELSPICENISIHYMLVNWEKICSDVTEASDSLVLLNEITAKLKWHYNQRHHFRATGDDYDFSSYLFLFNKSEDHCVIGFGKEYKTFRLISLIALILLSIMISIFIPQQSVNYLKQALEGENADDSGCFIGSVGISSILIYASMFPYCLWQITQRFPEAKAIADVQFNYAIIIVLLFLYPILIFMYVFWLITRKNLKENLINVYNNNYANFLRYFKNPSCLLIFLCIGLTAFVCTLQMISIYVIYIIVATFITPFVQSIVFVALWFLIMYNFQTLIYLLLQVGAINSRCSCGQFTLHILVFGLSVTAFMSLNLGGTLQVTYAGIWSLINTIILIAKKKEFRAKILPYLYSITTTSSICTPHGQSGH